MKYFNFILITAVFGLFVYACDTGEFLNAPAKGALSEDVLANEQGVQTLLVGAYGALDGQGGGDGLAWHLADGNAWEAAADNWIYGSVAGGDAHKGSNAGDQNAINPIARMNHNPTNGFFDSKWQVLYEGVARTNAVLELLERVEEEDMTAEAQTVAAAEARFLRGHYYFELKKMFGNVPWIDEETENPNQPNDQDIWPNIESDFQFAMDNLPETQGDPGRANNWAAASYLAKTYVYQEEWDEAKTLYDDIIPNGVTAQGVAYDLFDEFKDNFNPAAEDGSPETVFAIEMVANDGSGWISNGNQGGMLRFPYNSPFRCCGFYQPTQELVNSYKTVNGLPMEYNTYNNDPVENDQGISSSDEFEPSDKELDPRLDWTVGRRGVPYLDWGPHPGQTWIRDQDYAGPYAPKKNVWWQAQEDQYADNNAWAPGTAINYSIIRFADVLLMAAEAEVGATNGSLEQAREYVNRVRRRAADPEGWVDNDLNREYAAAVVNSEEEMLSADVSEGEWVVREDLNSTFVLVDGDENTWNEYEEPNYSIVEYPGPWANAEDAEEAIHFERKLELAMEGHRFFDLVRWGEADNKLNDFYQYEGNIFSDVDGGNFTPDRNEFYPIPQNQIDLSTVDGEPQLEQNPGY